MSAFPLNLKARPRPRRRAYKSPAITVPTRIEYTPFGPHATELGYRAAEAIRKSGRPPAVGGSADYHTRWDLKLLRAESQRFDRDNGLYCGTVNRLLDNILGDGLRFQARTGNPRTNKKLEQLWRQWCESPEVRCMDDWGAIERMVARHLIVDGDVAAIKADGGLIQVIEGERIDYRSNVRGGRRVESGIEVDAVGRPVMFHVADYGLDGYVQPKTTAYSADDVVFVAWRHRISQTRGVPVMVPSFPMFHRINDVCDSEAIAWQLLSRLAVAVNRTDAAALALNTSLEDSDASDVNIARRYHDIGEAVIFHGEPGEEIKGIERNIPGANFPQSIETFMRLLGLPIGFPLELMLLDWSKTNYSSARAAMLQAYRMLTRWQWLLMRSFHTPIYRWKVQEWINSGQINEVSDIYAHEWFPPPFPWIDPLKDAQADALLIDRGHATYAEVLKGQNRDREEMIELRTKEVTEAITAAKRIEKETGEKVPWQLFAGLDVGMAASPAAPQVDANSEETPETNSEAADMEQLRARIETYGIAVRAGAITPQTDDEDDFRKSLVLPPMSSDAKRAWSDDKGTRRPITITPPPGQPATNAGIGGGEEASDAGEEVPSSDENEEQNDTESAE